MTSVALRRHHCRRRHSVFAQTINGPARGDANVPTAPRRGLGAQRVAFAVTDAATMRLMHPQAKAGAVAPCRLSLHPDASGWFRL
jgi:hypothetical protein